MIISRIKFLTQFMVITFCTYYLYYNIMDANHGDSTSIAVLAAAFTLLSLHLGIVTSLYLCRWKKINDYNLLRKLFKFILNPPMILLFPVFIDEFPVKNGEANLFLSHQLLLCSLLAGLLWTDPFKFTSRYLIADGLVDNIKDKILYSKIPPEKFSDLYLTICLPVILFIIIVVF